MTRGARHNYGQSNQPFRHLPAGSRLAAITADIHHVLSGQCDPTGEVTAFIVSDETARLRELFAERMPDLPASEREAWARYAAEGKAEAFRLALGAPPPRRPGRPASDPLPCLIALAQYKICSEMMPGASQDRRYSATAEALGPGITRWQVRSAVQAAGAMGLRQWRRDAGSHPFAVAAPDAVELYWQEAVRRVATNAYPQQSA